MTDDDEIRLRTLLRAALPIEPRAGRPRDLWPLIEARAHAPVRWSWLDLGIAAVVAALLLMNPGWLGLLAFHL